jgi:hypothetical protein
MGLIPLGILSAAAGGQLPAYELIQTTILGTATASVTFSSLGTYSAVYKHLQLRMMARSNGPFGDDSIRLRLNGDSGSNYSFHQMYGSGSSVVSSGAASQTAADVIWIAGSGAASNAFGGGYADFVDAYSTTKNKTIRGLSGTTPGLIMMRSNAWLNTASITTIAITPYDGSTFNTGSRFSLYGIR